MGCPKIQLPALTTAQGTDIARLAGIEADADTAATQSTAAAASAATAAIQSTAAATDAATAATQSTAGAASAATAAATAATINANVGTKNDWVAVPYVAGNPTLLAYIVTGYYHVHGEAFLFPIAANPVTVTSAAAAWTLGAFAELIAAGATDRDFDLHWMQIGDISAVGNYELLIYKGLAGAEVQIGGICFSRTDNFSGEANQPVQVPQQVAGTRISVALRDSTTSARSCIAKTIGHYYG
jgi:hypothetical protein